MNTFLDTVKKSVCSFAKKEDGAQVVEYALIIAVVSIGLVLALGGGGNSISSKFADFVTKVGTCLSTVTC